MISAKKQKYRHDPDNGVFGDCYRTALAYLLRVDRDEVPHHVTTMSADEWATAVQPKYDVYLSTLGLQELAVPVTDSGLDVILDWQKTRTKIPTEAMLTGESKTGCNHVVVVFDGRIVFDPAIDDSGIIGPCEDGFYWITWLIPAPPEEQKGRTHDLHP